MGRTVKRVALDFSWPLDKVWSGYLNPHRDERDPCPHCGGRGDSPQVRRLHALWYGHAPFKPEDRGSVPWTPEDAATRRWAERQCRQSPEFYGTGEEAILRESIRICGHWNNAWSHHLNDDDVQALLDAGRLVEFTHTWTPEDGWQPRPDFVKPTARQVNEWSLMGMGHDSINASVVICAEAERLGHKTACEHCDGEGEVWHNEEARARYEAWKRQEPPAGEGFQMWETITEGSPISPVFETEEALAKWLVLNLHDSDERTSYSQWLEFIRCEGTAPTLMLTSEGLQTGVEAF